MKRFPLLIAALVVLSAPAAAQFARTNPFSLGINEGSVGEVGRVGLWLLRQQAHFYEALKHAVEAARASPLAAVSLAAVAFAYGVFHAAGPGHGKAVIASYMLANEKALRRGVVLSGLAALLQAIVAVTLVGIASILLGATATKMIAATRAVEIAAYLFIAALGLFLVWRKSSGLYAALCAPPIPLSDRFRCEDAAQPLWHGPNCAHCVAPDPGGENFSWRHSAATVVAAGLRPCSGALLVLVFAAAQNVFVIGVWAVVAMAAGTALTTAALAAGAVLAKTAATRMFSARRRSAEIFGRLVEVAAACVVLGLGVSLLAGLVANGGA